MPPTGVTKGITNNVGTLNWNSAPPGNGIDFYVYKGTDSLAGPFTRVALNPATPYILTHVPGDLYMVRAAQRKYTGSGSYYNLSQGVIP